MGSAEELAEKGAQVDEVRSQLEAHGFDTEDFPTGYRPFGLSTKDRFQAAGIHDADYDLLYSIASDYAHMNARAVERVLDHDFGTKDAMGEMAITTDFLIRILTAANDKLGTDLGPDIEALKVEYVAADAEDAHAANLGVRVNRTMAVLSSRSSPCTSLFLTGDVTRSIPRPFGFVSLC